jgi:hypothetical protein
MAKGSRPSFTCPGCGRNTKHYGRGYCRNCHARAYRRGLLGPAIPWSPPTDPPTEPPRLHSPRLPQRFWWKVQDEPGGCWLWTHNVTRLGYGMFHVGDRDRPAHIVAYEALVGPVPDEHELDHLCHSGSDCDLGNSCPHRRCVNPLHLEPVTHERNMYRARRAYCKRGHPLEPWNLLPSSDGGRRCRTCANMSQQRRRATARALARSVEGAY